MHPFDPAALPAWTPADGTLWLHFDLCAPATREWLTTHSGLPPLAVAALLDAESRPRLVVVGEGALLALRGVNLSPGAAPDDMIGIRIWLEENRVITSFRRQLRSVDDLFEALREGEGPTSPADVVVRLASRLVTRMTETIDNLENTIDDLEEKLVDDETRGMRYALSGLRRQIIALRRYLAPQREALASVILCKIPWINEHHRLLVRETSDRLIRHLEDLDAIRERAAVTQEELQSRHAEQQNIRMYVLSIVAAIFLPLGFLTGLLGINVGGIPGSDNPAAFPIFAGFLLLIVILELLYFRSRHWF